MKEKTLADDKKTESNDSTEEGALTENIDSTEEGALTESTEDTDTTSDEREGEETALQGAGNPQEKEGLGKAAMLPMGGVAAVGLASHAIKKMAPGLAGTVAQNLLGAAMSGFMNTGRRDPDLQFSFMVEIDSMSLGMFSEISGIEWEMRSKEIKEGGVNNHTVHLLEGAKFSGLTLKRGFVGNDNYLYQMMFQSMDPNTPIQRQTVHVIPMARSTGGGAGGLMGMNELGRITFYDCFVEKWSGPSFNSKTNEIAVESVTFKYSYLAFHPGGPLGQLMEGVMSGVMSGGLSAL
jgi:phage tail-like protein